MRNQVGQVNVANYMDDAYRARYGKFDSGKAVQTSVTKTSSAHVLTSVPASSRTVRVKFLQKKLSKAKASQLLRGLVNQFFSFCFEETDKMS